MAAVIATSAMVLAVVTIDAGPAQAQTARKDASIKPGEKVLTRDELRQCFTERNALAAQADAYDREKQDLDAERATIRAAGTVLAEEREKLDTLDPAAVSAFQDKASAHDARIDAYNARLPAFNLRGETLAANRALYKQGCADRPYRESDELILRREAAKGKK
jgi:hypothetical protein